MTKVSLSDNPGETTFVANLLEGAGIAYELRNESSYANLPGTCFLPELWIAHDADLPRVNELIAKAREDFQKRTRWRCDHCGEECESPFDSCWNCGSPRPESAIPSHQPDRGQETGPATYYQPALGFSWRRKTRTPPRRYQIILARIGSLLCGVLAIYGLLQIASGNFTLARSGPRSGAKVFSMLYLGGIFCVVLLVLARDLERERKSSELPKKDEGELEP